MKLLVTTHITWTSPLKFYVELNRSPAHIAIRLVFVLSTEVPEGPQVRRVRPRPLRELRRPAFRHMGSVISDAESVNHQLNNLAQPALRATARLPLRTESIASSKVEGLQLDARWLARAEADSPNRRVGTRVIDILSNIDAMGMAVERAASNVTITPRLLRSCTNLDPFFGNSDRGPESRTRLLQEFTRPSHPLPRLRTPYESPALTTELQPRLQHDCPATPLSLLERRSGC
jgi:hypothetical protein